MEQRPIFRQIAASFDGTVIAVSEFEHYVQIWDVSTYQCIASFKTTLDFGGRRIAISRDGHHCVVGAYHVQGVAHYDTTSGNEIWRRKDLKKVQTIRISKSDRHILCSFDGKSFKSLNLANGHTVSSFPGFEDIWESHYDTVTVLNRKSRDYKLITDENKKIANLPRRTFAALDFAFAPLKLCISESGGAIFCYDVKNGQELWHFDPGNGIHALNLAYNESAGQFAAITWPYEKGGDHNLINLDPQTGAVCSDVPITGAHEQAFCCKGSLLVTSDGKIRDAATAELLEVLNFLTYNENIG